MPTAGSYRLEHQLSTCTVGDVWSSVDAQGRPVTVARLNELASADDRWRQAFAAAAETLAASETDQLVVTDADLSGERPWVASDGAAGEIFSLLGQNLTPVGAVPASLSAAGDATHQTSDAVRTESAPATETDPPTLPFQPVLTDSARPVPAVPVSAQPASGLPAFDRPVSAVPVSGAPTPYRGMGSPERPGRLLVVIVGLVSLLVGAAGGAAIVAAADGDDEPAPVVSTAPVAFTDAQLLLPGTPPAAPGLPPEPDEWPDNTWPTFGDEAAGATEITGLEGLGFNFLAPEGWKCTLAEKADAAVHYRCGAFEGDTLTVGGDIVVRACAPICDNTTRVALRAREEAWGLRWTGGTTVQSWVENPSVNGKPEYGLVYVGFTRTAVEQVLSREVVLRMTAPSARADDVKKVAASVLDRTYAQ
ncbi:hypothetical protein Acy02nite_10480 [Actinoplanes cyaneus]|uniref:Uncharacterized protein n=1 Tax=Actinoplanes cyaneus TaxID=52696 RepID=A0A919IF00_9ACTN|nr:hypothetical protein [Actinoplanes cyaneus]MCW2137116.1 hypothetical protein [Actinoplanes cyaneus]GID63167.1 hypothetical protein Acy02nite_10480 [Actinoplanes cyaneus]